MFDSASDSNLQKKMVAGVEEKSQSEKNEFESDIEVLKKRFGEFHVGKVIEITLQDLLTICPRNRRRTDAYDRLVKYVYKIYGVTLIIKSQKTK